MANTRVLVRRRKSVRNIRKITRTMQLIATARFQAAFNRAVATKPYTTKLSELVGELSRHAGDLEHPLLKENEGTNRSALLVLTSNRGLCGGYNSNVLRTAMAHRKSRLDTGETVDLHMIGRKGIAYLRFLRIEAATRQAGLEDKPAFEAVDAIAQGFIEQYVRQEIDAVYVTYMRFYSAGRQRAEVLQLLPIPRSADVEASAQAPASGPAAQVQYEFSPEPRVLLGELLPASVKARLFQCFIDAAVSEQVARMAAMKAATDAAGDMIKLLTRQYNRARQTRITMELLDILGGVEALKG